MLGELLENRNGPTSVSQHGACCVPDPVTVSTAPFRTRLISFAWRIVTYASFPRVTSPNGALTFDGMFDTTVAVPLAAASSIRFTVSITLFFSVMTSWFSTTPTWAADPSAKSSGAIPSAVESMPKGNMRCDSTAVVPSTYRWSLPKATLTGFDSVDMDCPNRRPAWGG